MQNNLFKFGLTPSWAFWEIPHRFLNIFGPIKSVKYYETEGVLSFHQKQKLCIKKQKSGCK
jgi:hypothetical protein